ncbi:MAG: tetratricopeptide repeat protein [Spirochaetales bacterium]|uniref:Tetratricopeptide repeat protein n=1 Tax=Candidatus Thalassospirochaeta sargassi TaxID=3119039 RepID=A0AAJ1MJ71_9SPIO|nr:tetratricopeptide repeat protein [Spirochaetales bacterium]
MEKRILIAAAAAAVVLSACSNPAVYFSVWQGNNAFAGGDYQTANTEYLASMEKDVYTDYLSYNLANVYYALGEGEAASAEWKEAAFTSSRELLYRTMYNRGLFEFESGNYETAFDLFRKALEINPESLDAKINLEYSLRRMNAGANSSEASAAGAQNSGSDEVSDEIMRVLEFIKQKDAGIWTANEEENVVTGGKDW